MTIYRYRHLFIHSLIHPLIHNKHELYRQRRERDPHSPSPHLLLSFSPRQNMHFCSNTLQAVEARYLSYRNALETDRKVQENIIEILKEVEWSQQCYHSNSISPWTTGSGGKHEERWIKIEKFKSFVLHDSVFLEASLCDLEGRMVNVLTLYFKAVKHSPQFTPHFIANLHKFLLHHTHIALAKVIIIDIW